MPALTPTPHSEDELLTRLRTVRLKGFGQPEIYRNTSLQLFYIPISLLVPCQSYVLMDRVEDLIRLRERIENETGKDIFKFGGDTGYLDIGLSDGAQFPLLPPMCEYFDQEMNTDTTFRKQILINDGIHRVYAAKLSGLKSVTVALSSKPDWPYYALPNQIGWEGVQEIRGALPENFPKKRYRLPDPVMYKQLYRDFNTVFPGVQEDRPKGLVA